MARCRSKPKINCNISRCQKTVDMKYFKPNYVRTNPLSDPEFGAFLPAVTVCKQRLCPIVEPIIIAEGEFSNEFTSEYLRIEFIEVCPNGEEPVDDTIIIT
jgi:hypothetical protein